LGTVVRPLASLPALALFALALTLRWPGLGYLLPCDWEPDAVWAILAGDLHLGYPPSGDHATAYPNLAPYLIDLLRSLWERWAGAGPPITLDEHLRQAAAPAYFARLLTALITSLAAPACWVLARNFMTRGWALLAGALCASSLFLIQYSVQGRPHATLAAVFVACALAGLAIHRRGSWIDYLGGGAAAAAGCLLLQSGVFGALPLGLGHFLRPRGERRFARLLACAVLVLAAIVRSWPSLPWTAETAHVNFEMRFDGRSLPMVVDSLVDLDPLASSLGLLALGGLVWRWMGAFAGHPRARGPSDAAWIALAAFFPYALTFGLFHNSYPRFFTPLVPAVAVLASWLCARTAERARPLARALGLFLGLSCLAAAVAASARFAWLRTRPTTLDLTARWVEQSTSKSDVIAFSPAAELPLFVAQASIDECVVRNPVRETHYWVRYLWAACPPARGERQVRLRYLPSKVLLDPSRLPAWIELGPPDWWILWGTSYTDKGPGEDMLRAHLLPSTQPSFRTQALVEADGSASGMSYDDFGRSPLEAARRLWRAERLGPAVSAFAEPSGH
jgi:hypothetical protein